MTLLITIRSTEDGYYHWELRDGPDGAFEYTGYTPLLERCFEEILRAQWGLAEHLTRDLNPENGWLPDPPPDFLTIAQVHAAGGRFLPAQQDIPASAHPIASLSSIYLPPSNSG
jgi:hypothetical protein